jgi:hypothetical protein
MKSRLLKDGRRTNKQKPGPKPKKIQELGDWAAILVFHALKTSPRLRRSVLKPSADGYSDRQFACLALAATAPEVEISRQGDTMRLSVMRLRKHESGAEPNNLFDALIGRHRKIMRERASARDRRGIERYASLFCRCAFPHRAAYTGHPILFTPAGIIGETRAWPLRAADTIAKRMDQEGASPWEKVAAVASAYQNNADEEGPRLSQRATAELRSIGFPVDEVLKRLNIL